MPAHPTGPDLSELIPLLVLAGALAVYEMAAARQRIRPAGWSPWRTASFAFGMLLLAVAWSPHLAAWAHEDLRGHMIQHLLIGMFAPLGLILAAPAALALRTFPAPAARRITGLFQFRALRWLTHPVTTLLLNTGGMYLLYLTPLYALSQQDAWLHALVHVHFLLAGCLFSYAVAAPHPMFHRSRMFVRLAVLFLAVAAHAILAKLLVAGGFSQTSVLVTEEQRLAAAQFMYYGGDLAEVLLALAVFIPWYRQRGQRLPARVV